LEASGWLFKMFSCKFVWRLSRRTLKLRIREVVLSSGQRGVFFQEFDLLSPGACFEGPPCLFNLVQGFANEWRKPLFSPVVHCRWTRSRVEDMPFSKILLRIGL